ncbi:MAG TPA: MFS transporter [Ktedonobacterales bacterium]|nr:MFS transporter [Ktedonobacterales bacterium]
MAGAEVAGSIGERPAPDSGLRQGEPAFYRMTLALFLAGCAVFSILYCTQPILPELSRRFVLSPTEASLSISVPTATMALAMLVMSAISEATGRVWLMAGSLLAAAALQLLLAFSPTYGVLLVLRGLQGIALAGAPATVLAYVAEETSARAYGFAVGLYISGTTIGGMLGRFAVGALADHFSWQAALGVIGLTGMALSAGFAALLPRSRHFTRRPFAARALAATFAAHLRDPALLRLYVVGFLIMGSFVTVYNYTTFRLAAPPYSLSQTQVGLVFAIYLVGTVSSTWMGRMADRAGRRRILWVSVALMLAGLGVTLAVPLWLALLGVAVFTFGFFGAHTTASGWIGKRAQTGRAQASALYFAFYYTGSSIVGATGGLAWSAFHWPGVTAMLAVLLLLALGLALGLRHIPPLNPQPEAPPEIVG